MRILHTESSKGWGGQEIRILREAEGMRARGHEVILAVAKGGGLVEKARRAGFTVYEVKYQKQYALPTLFQLLKIIAKHQIDIINTHSSLDAWMGGIAARIKRKKIIRTRHLSTPIRKGINSRLLYKGLADYVVTTSSSIRPMICDQSRLDPSLCRTIATGVNPERITAAPSAVAEFRKKMKVEPDELLIGTACFVRSWKGIRDLMQTAQILKRTHALKWVIIGGGYIDDYRGIVEELNIGDVLTFTGHLDDPYPAIAALDIFVLLSTAHEGVSQAALQAAFLQRPLVTTTVGGLPEVCIDCKTGFLVPPFAPQQAAERLVKLIENPSLRQEMGENGKKLILEKFTLEHMLDQMEEIYHQMK